MRAGLSLTSFELSFAGAAPQHSSLHTAGDASLNISVTVANTGKRVGDEVIQAYFLPSKLPGLKLHPRKAMFDFVRVSDLQPGAKTTVSFSVSADSLLLATESGDLVREPGDYALSFEDGAGGELRVPLTVAGERKVVEPFPAVPGAK